MPTELSARAALPSSRVFMGSGEPIEQEHLLEFRLLYEGPLPSSGNRSTVEAKHAIRKTIHLQLRQLWRVHPGLRQFAANLGAHENPREGTTEQDRIDDGFGAMGKQWARAGYDFVPLVTPKYVVRCGLEILLLRPEGEQSIKGTDRKFIMNRGDLDGQVKTLFDALQLPEQAQDLPPGSTPASDEVPFFCLLSNDRLISEVRVNGDNLLLLPNAKTVEATDSFVVIHVRINHVHGGPFDRWFD